MDEYDYHYALVNFTFHTTADTSELMRKIMDNIAVQDYKMRITPYGVSVKIKSAVSGGLLERREAWGII